jgi:hypothetical protein
MNSAGGSCGPRVPGKSWRAWPRLRTIKHVVVYGTLDRWACKPAISRCQAPRSQRVFRRGRVRRGTRHSEQLVLASGGYPDRGLREATPQKSPFLSCQTPRRVGRVVFRHLQRFLCPFHPTGSMFWGLASGTGRARSQVLSEIGSLLFHPHQFSLSGSVSSGPPRGVAGDRALLRHRRQRFEKAGPPLYRHSSGDGS